MHCGYYTYNVERLTPKVYFQFVTSKPRKLNVWIHFIYLFCMSYSVGKKKEMKELRRSGSDDVQVVELGKYSNTLHFTSIHFCFSISFLKLF